VNQAPRGVDWKEINSSHFRVIFPSDIEDDAKRIVVNLERLYWATSRSLATSPKKIPVVLQNRLSVSNGFVALGPRKSEWYHQPNTPSLLSGSGVDDWYDLLATHEYRHVVQFDAMNKGATKIASFVFGDFGRSVLSFLSFPLWYFEGDAVGMETAVGLGGRGRQPWFEMHTRSLLLEDVVYPYQKAVNRSYKHFYANQYPLGYELTTYVKKEHGSRAWSEIIDKTSKWSFLPLSFHRSVKNTLGASVDTIYRQSLNMIQITNGRLINNASEKSSWTSYAFPQYQDNGDVIAIKVSMSEPAKWVTIDSEGNEDLGSRVDSWALNSGFDYSNGRVVWSRNNPSIRWGNSSTNVVMVKDVDGRRSRQITSDSNTLMPSFSQDGTRIAAVEYLQDRSCSIVIIDADTGREIDRIGAGKDEFFMSPSWSPDDSKLVATKQAIGGKSLVEIDLASRQIKDLIETGTEDFNEPKHMGNVIYYHSGLSGIENIWALDLESGKKYQVTSRIVGAMHPSISQDGTKLLYNDYSTLGFDVFEAEIDRRKWKYAPQVRDRTTPYYAPIIEQEDVGPFLLTSTANYDDRKVEDYKGPKNLFKFHSWSPILSDENMGLLLSSNNLLNTFNLDLIADHNRVEHRWKNTIRASYTGLYPIFQLEASQEWQEEMSDCDSRGTENITSCSVQEFVGRVILPFNLSRGINNRHADISFGGEVLRAAPRSTVEDPSILWVNSYNATASLSQIRSGAFRDFWPGFSQFIRAEYEKTTPESGAVGQRAFLSGLAFVPSLFNQHTIRLRGAIELQEPETWLYDREINLARGYDFIFRNELTNFGVDYKFPLAYPDLAGGNIAFLKRIVGGFFYDYSQGNSEFGLTNVDDFTASSYGAELRFDFHLFNWPVEFQAGVRAGMRLDDMPGTGDGVDKKGFFIEPVIFGVGL